MSQILLKIKDSVQKQLIGQKQRLPLNRSETYQQRHVDFEKALHENGTNIIAEVKFASPSQGRIYEPADPVGVATQYIRSGARALSVLTETEFFDGDPSYLASIRAEFPLMPILMKDFVIDPYQVHLAKHLGANAILLIAALLDKELPSFYELALDSGLTPLVEVHNEEELKLALKINAKCIGINNRNLKTMEVSLDTCRRLSSLVPRDRTLIAESGLQTLDELLELQALGFNAFLIGTSLMNTGEPGKALSKLLGPDHEN